MDTLVFDAAAVAVCVGLGFAIRNRKPAIRSAPVPRVSAIARSMRDLRRRHRRAARAIVDLAYECIERHPDGSFEAFTARETLLTYLPHTLTAYFLVPRALRRVPLGAGSSADDELSRQLRTLQAGLEGIREADARSGATQMAANGAFLSERFAAPHSARPADRRPLLGELADILEGALRRS